MYTIPSTSTDDVAITTDDISIVDDDTKYCYCQGGEHGEMVGCDNTDCSYQWFHLDCLHLSVPPKGKLWYCPDCSKLDKFSKKKKVKSKR